MPISRPRPLKSLVTALVSGLLLLFGGPPIAAVPFADFEPVADELSWIDTYLLALASSAAYRGPVKDLAGETFADKFSHVYEPLGLEVVAFLEAGEAKTGTQALVLRNEAIVLVVFCGSEGHDTTAATRDWLTDARIWPLEVDGMQIHRGFHYALGSVWEALYASVAPLQSSGLQLWLTGHSLGGALANLAAYRLEKEGVAVAGVYTFAAPKLGDQEFVADFEQCLGVRSQQWSTELDPITRMPEITRRAAYEKLGVTNVVRASGQAELDTVQKMSRFPNPWAHRVSAYVNYLYRALPTEVRAKVPIPPPLCATTSVHVGEHPVDGFALCRERLRKVSRKKCSAEGGTVIEPWCLTEDPGKFRYRAQRLKAPKAESAKVE
ncbi:MAG: lipase family protein [Acidobacteriota bacterium]